MESFWCSRKNSIVAWLNDGIDFDPALLPGKKSEGEKWENGECIHMSKVENHRFRVLLADRMG